MQNIDLNGIIKSYYLAKIVSKDIWSSYCKKNSVNSGGAMQEMHQFYKQYFILLITLVIQQFQN